MGDYTVSECVHLFQRELTMIYPSSEIRQFSFIIFNHRMNFTATEILTKGDLLVNRDDFNWLQECIRRLKKMEPVQYILGETEFLDLRLKVNPSVLIPRPETEELVLWVLESVWPHDTRVVDIGTGSGCIALSLKSRLPDLSVSAWDISEKALETARRNAEANNLELCFKQVDILSLLPSKYKENFDVIISNPPYVRHQEKALMANNVLNYEPHTALFVADQDPLLFYREIARLGKVLLKSGGQLFFEINEALGTETMALVAGFGYTDVQIRKDISGKDRMLRAVWK